LDEHRKYVLAAYPKDLTLTELYNVLSARRQFRTLTPKEEQIDSLSNVAIMQHLHDRLDEAVAAAYGWPADLSDAQYVERVVALNRTRYQEESNGRVLWLRPEYQNPTNKALPTQISAELDDDSSVVVQIAWPKQPIDQIQIVLQALKKTQHPIHVKKLAGQFKGARSKDVSDYLKALASTGVVRHFGEDRYTL
jgi:hypothetical protein